MSEFYHLLFAIFFGIFAAIGVIATLTGIYKLVMWVGEKIDQRWTKWRKRSDIPKEHLTVIPDSMGRAPMEWSKDGETARIISEKHKHLWRVHRDVRFSVFSYPFQCDCGEYMRIPRQEFWGGEKTTQQMYEDAIRAFRAEQRVEFDV